MQPILSKETAKKRYWKVSEAETTKNTPKITDNPHRYS